MSQELRKKRVFTYTVSNGELDAVNRRILEELQRDPRVTMTELGRRIGMSSPAVTERVRRLEEAGVIRGYRLDVNPAAIGLPIALYIRIRPNPGQLPRIAELAQQIPMVLSQGSISALRICNGANQGCQDEARCPLTRM